MEHLIEWFNRNMGSESSSLEWYWRLTIILAVVLAAYLVNFIFMRAIIPVLRKITERTETKIDDILLKDRVVRAFGSIIPAVILTGALPFVTQGSLEVLLSRITVIYIIICITRFLCVLVSAVFEAYEHVRSGKVNSLKGLVQTIQIVISAVAAILVVSTLLDKSPAIILSGLGAMAAVMMLVFQDSIKGLVAGIQLTFNDMLRPNDWISMPSRNVDGVVVEITLTTVKVRNWDNTILTIPPYSLLTETFQNWRGMQESDGRRVCRQVNVDVRSVSFVTAEDVKAIEKQGFPVEDVKLGETTNLELFRAQLYRYLASHPAINQKMTLMVRQLKMHNSEGVPVEIYAFTHTKVWEEYEEIQARLIEYMISLMKVYRLAPYERSGGLPASLPN